MKRLLCVLGICLIAGCSKQGGGSVSAAAASSPAQDAAPQKKLLIVATIAPMYCFAKNVAGDFADVEMIVPPGVNPAGFEPSPDQIARIRQADVVIENGFAFEPWMDRLAAAGLKPGATRVIAARGTGPGIPGLADPNTPTAQMPDNDGGPPDPHVWLDPLMAIKEVQNIADALMQRDAAHANDYFTNASRYETTLRELDDEAGQMTVDIPKRKLVCVTGALFYFLARYDFQVMAVAPTSAEALTAARQKQADAVIAPAGTAILNAGGFRVVSADPMEKGPASTDFYEQQTRANAAALREALLQ